MDLTQTRPHILRRPMPARKRKTVGIDLGTTNTVVARNFEALSIEGSGCVMPSAVAFPPSGATLVGSAARRRRAMDPKNTVLSAKRIIGARWRSSYTGQFREHYPYDLVEGPDGWAVFKTRAGLKCPVDIGGTVVSGLCELTKCPVQDVHAVVTAPVGFDRRRREATSLAVSKAKFASVRVIEEPIATALAYLNRASLKYAFVYDLGGGTFDAAVVDCSSYPFRVIGHGGDPYLGGDDVDRTIALHVADRTLARDGWDLSNDAVTFDRLVLACELAKCELSESEQAAIAIPSVDAAAPESCGIITITREEVQQLTLDLVHRTFAMCDEVLAQAGVKARDMEAIFLAGGSTRLPGLRGYIESYFGKRPRFDLDPMQVVSMGASLAAARPAVAELLDPCA
ncbi:MAG: Hsp70 family protein [Deltaproteobacteria bacterium]|nr:Hsp70 family protein [Deltaproteobacteria bacterium]